MSTSFSPWITIFGVLNTGDGGGDEMFDCLGLFFFVLFFLPLAVKSAVCAGSFHLSTAKPALKADRRVIFCTQVSTRGQSAAFFVSISQ